MTESTIGHIVPGLAILQSNRMEALKDLLIAWLRNNPLPPFETETILVQSNGMSQWLKMGLAEDSGLGISAGVQIMLPSTFLWRVYRKVLGESTIPATSPLDLEPMIWRLFGLLPDLIARDPEAYKALQLFMADDPRQERRYQLAQQIATLFDQYQVYRPDWLQLWKKGQPLDDITIPDELAWQAKLWRELIDPLEDDGNSTSRAFLNDQLVSQLNTLSQEDRDLPPGLPQRLIIFGISSLPGQTLEAIRALSQKMQVLYFVQNPCQEYWADILDAREAAQVALRHQLKRHHFRADVPKVHTDELHLEGNPLLAAWGKQGRDFVRLLESFDQPETYHGWFDKIDVFDEIPAEKASLLQQIQNAILHREPLPASGTVRPMTLPTDTSIRFQITHTRQREVEVLHDQLLHLFDQHEGVASTLQPRDVIVMVPDIDRYAPHIEAVFGQIPHDDPRHIPFSIADRRQRGHNPIHLALEYLLQLPESRLSASEVLDLLDVAALRRRFGLKDTDLPLIKRWIMDAGIRWGLDAHHRGPLDPNLELEQNTWKFGLDRMALGYCMGDVETLSDIAPLGAVGGMEGDRLGPLWLFVEALAHHQRELETPATVDVWTDRLEGLIQAFFDPDTQEDRKAIERLGHCLRQWQKLCHEGEIVDPIQLAVVREAWLSSVDTPNLTQRFLAGRVNFCTLMPMRSIPFKVVCLLGMNDGEFPRVQPRRVFDLMSLPNAYRPGDRSRRDDDRYMFLEAILAAKDQLIISWVGRHVRDDAELPPSVLVSQFRDYIASGWTLHPGDRQDATPLLDHLTLRHGLQPFSPLYFTGESPHFSYAREWRTPLLDRATLVRRSQAEPLPPIQNPEPLTLSKLERFLKNPAQVFFEQRLGIQFQTEDRSVEDLETFTLDRLNQYVIGNDLVKIALRDPGIESQDLDAATRQLSLSGHMPIAGFGELTLQDLRSNALTLSQRYAALLDEGWASETLSPVALQLDPFLHEDREPMVLEDWLTDLRSFKDQRETLARIEFRPSTIYTQNVLSRHPLVGLWIRHLAALASGLNLTSILIASDATLRLPPFEATVARRELASLIEALRQGLSLPLPVAIKTSLAWLSAKPDQQETEATKVFEGDGYRSHGEVEGNPYLQRAYPTFEDLVSAHTPSGGFPEWTERLYQPLVAAQLMTLEDEE